MTSKYRSKFKVKKQKFKQEMNKMLIDGVIVDGDVLPYTDASLTAEFWRGSNFLNKKWKKL